MSNHVLVILQARMSSSRLPGKVLMNINGKPMIHWQIQRILKSSLVSQLVVATSVDSSDDSLVKFLEENSIIVRRGSLDDVLSRFIQVANEYPYDALIRLTGDCPLVMPELIDQMIDSFFEQKVDYLSNTLVPTFPDGLDIEVLNSGVLEKLTTFGLTNKELEHVTYGVYTRPETFRLKNFLNDTDRSQDRWTVDYQEDFDFVQAIFQEFSGRETFFSYEEVCDFLSKNPGLKSRAQSYQRNEQLFKDKNHG